MPKLPLIYIKRSVILVMLLSYWLKSGRVSTLLYCFDTQGQEVSYTAKVVRAMSKKEEYELKSERLLQPIMDEHKFKLVDVEYVKEGATWYLRAYVDKEGGITIDDCEVVSRAFGKKLDEEDFIEDSYIMEVSSPGLGRPLKKEKDFKRSVGKEVEIRTYRAIERQKEFYGLLNAYDENSVTILTGEGNTRTFDKKDIALIRLALDF